MAEMTEEQRNEQRNQVYRQIADSFINVANQHAEQQNQFMVGSAFLYGAARFSAFVTAVQAQELEQYDGDRGAAIEYFTSEFRRMLEENLDNYRQVFKPEQATEVGKYRPEQPQQEQQAQRILNYEHLVKKSE